MSRFTIYSANGDVRYTGCPQYNGVKGGVSSLEFRNVASPTPIGWKIGDYVEYGRTGLKYQIYSIPQPTRQARTGSAGDAFLYPNVILHAATKLLDLAPFRDLVLRDNNLHFSSRAGFTTYENVQGIVNRLQANADNARLSFTFMVYDGLDEDTEALMAEQREFEVGEVTILGALNHIADVWEGIGWVHTYDAMTQKDVITIGRPNVRDTGNTTSTFMYGRGKGLKVLKRNIATAESMATRIYAYGSERNMPYRYYNVQDIYQAGSVDIPNLMIPSDYWGVTSGKPDASKAYMESRTAIIKYGLVPLVARFDGSGEYQEIFPTIKDMTYGRLRQSMSPSDPYYPSTVLYADTDKVAVIKTDDTTTDNGLMQVDGKSTAITTYSISENDSRTITARTLHPLMTIKDGITLTKAGRVSVAVKISARIQPAAGSTVDVSKIRLCVRCDGRLYNFPALKILALMSNYNIDGTIDLGTQPAGSALIIYFDYQGQGTFDFNISGTADVQTPVTEIPAQCNVTIRQVGFDIMQQAALSQEGSASIVMTSGLCAGRTFAVKGARHDSLLDVWTLTIQRDVDNAYCYPNTDFHIKAGDEFVITGIAMPEVYVREAERRLYEAAVALLREKSAPALSYEPDIDSKVMAESGERITEGMYMKLADEDLIDGYEFVPITSLTIDESAGAVPTYRVTLNDKPKKSVLKRMLKVVENGMVSSRRVGDVAFSQEVANREDGDSMVMERVHTYFNENGQANDAERLGGMDAEAYMNWQDGSAPTASTQGRKGDIIFSGNGMYICLGGTTWKQIQFVS